MSKIHIYGRNKLQNIVLLEQIFFMVTHED